MRFPCCLNSNLAWLSLGEFDSCSVSKELERFELVAILCRDIKLRCYIYFREAVWVMNNHFFSIVYSQYVSLSIHELVAIQTWDSWKFTAQRMGRQGKKDQRPSSNLGPTLYRGVSATSYQSQSRSPVPNCPLIQVTGVPLSSSRLRPVPWGWYCVRCDGSRLSVD